ncbi:MAG: PIG-L deacetylase family protein [Chloroflexota bacterium]
MSAPVYALVISPHPDDAEFGASGTVALWTREGKRVVYVVCTSGDKGTSDPSMKPERLARIREREQRAAAKVLGVSRVVFLRHPDQGLEDTPEFRKELVREIRGFRPQVVMAPDPYRRYIWHRDHRIAGQVVLDAVYPYARDRLAYPDLLAEGLKPHVVKEVWMWGTEDPNHKIDVTRSYALKLAALRCHQSQVGGHLFPEVEKRIRERNKSMAEGEPYELAEGFHRVEILR